MAEKTTYSRYYVGVCLECNHNMLIRMEYLKTNKTCCIKPDNLKILKEFNDENEAKNYLANLG